MQHIRFQIPNLTVEQRELLIKALNYYRLSAVEFLYSTDEVILDTTILMDLVQFEAKMIERDI